MSLTYEQQERAQKLYQAMLTTPHWVGGDGRSPLWWGHLVSSILVVTGEDEITYVTLRSEGREDEAGAFDLEGVIFTDRVAVHFTGVAVDRNDYLREPAVQAVPLSELTSVDVWSEADTQDQLTGMTWPGNVKATLLFRSGKSVAIPLRRPQNQDERTPLQRVVVGLSRHL
ncbi:hypothetical protein SAMN05216184_104114 [Georgenia satyanarayanai]|uniref:Uncharacterized protein n=1 Tax=Georgenia satyanarayanai TaxID=860221 RepID=A0A2Y9A7I0_9MICO|nr:hypothetical protein [Georgenia satyanarayanai]PYG00175.1 hypothetical protein A8987_104114 [Georgenia satyanarayanai]SSA40404.1 hypothetical protein SAMN05216184_104114 [Georgenia satyanarayanai]